MRAEQLRAAKALRAEGKTWVQIAAQIRERWPELNARAAMRIAHGWTQQDAADRWNDLGLEPPRVKKDFSDMERRRPKFAALANLARLYECALSDLVAGIADYRHLDQARRAPAIRAVREPVTALATEIDSNHDGDVDRRDFATRAAALAAVGLAEPLRALTGLVSHNREVIGADHVQFVHDSIARIDDHDRAHGGALLRPSVLALSGQVEDWLTGDYALDRGVGEELQTALGGLYSWSGWLALDDDDKDAARRHISEALLQARIADDPRLEVEAMDRMWFLLRTERPRESLQCSQAAQRTAQGWGTPRVHALIHLRLAHAHAHLGEEAAFHREIAKCMSQLDKGPHPDDPPFFHFMTPMELTGLRARCLQVLGKPDRAIPEYQAITENPDPAYRRNLGIYTVRLAQAHAANRDITAAAQTGLSALTLVSELHSTRARQHLAELRTAIEPHHATPAARDFIERYDQETATK